MNPALSDLITLLAKIAVEEYLAEMTSVPIAHGGSPSTTSKKEASNEKE